MLAFNRKAAEELRMRTRKALNTFGQGEMPVQAKTFHGLGLEIHGAFQTKPRIAPWASSEQAAQVKLEEFVERFKANTPGFLLDWCLLQSLFPYPGDKSEQAKSTRNRPTYRTRQGEIVESLETLEIADFLFLHGIAYQYKSSFPKQTATRQHHQYQPDFYYPDIDTWHEHSTHDANGRAPPTVEYYEEGDYTKRKLYQTHEFNLITTTSHEFASGTVFESLTMALKERGLNPSFNTNRQFQTSNCERMQSLFSTLRRFIARSKEQELSQSQLQQRLAQTPGATRRESLFIEIACQLREAWNEALQSTRTVDYEDMLLRGVQHLESGRWQAPWELVMVDEFQDVSPLKLRMIKALVFPPGRYLLAVGDDWQSINRFAGADSSVMQRFKSDFPESRTLSLERTFRFGQRLADVASMFVMKNPAQLQKSVRSDQSSPKRVLQAYVLDERSGIPEAVWQWLTELVLSQSKNKRSAPKKTVWVLVRYNRDLADFLPGHSEDPLMSLMNTSIDPYPQAEERRLFYVALTRARERVVLFSAMGRVSPFLHELARDDQVKIRPWSDNTDHYPPCPACNNGLLVPRTGRYGDFFGCDTYPTCRHTRSIETNANHN